MGKFCSNCGKELNEGAAFCEGCGTPVVNAQTTPAADEKEQIIFEAKGSLVGGGMGKIILTNKHIMWNKSAANFVAGGVIGLLTKGSTAVNINDILSVDTFVFLGGAGLQALANDGKKYKFGFNKKSDRDIAMSYIQEKIS